MRVIITARQSLTPVYEAILTRLVNILGEISKNPSNPKFNQYCFESVSALIRFVCEGTPAALPRFEQAIFGPAQVILAQDVAGKLRSVNNVKSRLIPQNLSHTSSRSSPSYSSYTRQTIYLKSIRLFCSLCFLLSFGNSVGISRLLPGSGRHCLCEVVRPSHQAVKCRVYWVSFSDWCRQSQATSSLLSSWALCSSSCHCKQVCNPVCLR